MDRGALNRIADFGHAGDTLVAYGERRRRARSSPRSRPGSTVAGVRRARHAVELLHRRRRGRRRRHPPHRRRALREPPVALDRRGRRDGHGHDRADLREPGDRQRDPRSPTTRSRCGRPPAGCACRAAARPSRCPTGPCSPTWATARGPGRAASSSTAPRSTAAPFTTSFSAVPGAAELFIQRPGVLLRRVADDLFLPLGRPAAGRLDRDRGRRRGSTRSTRAARSMRARWPTRRPAPSRRRSPPINALRAEAGIAPLIADAGISGALASGGSPGCLTTCGPWPPAPACPPPTPAGRWVAAGLAGVTDPRVTRAGAAQGPDGRHAALHAHAHGAAAAPARLSERHLQRPAERRGARRAADAVLPPPRLRSASARRSARRSPPRCRSAASSAASSCGASATRGRSAPAVPAAS